MKKTFCIIILLSLLCWNVVADQFSSKSTGLTSIPKLENLDQVKEILEEHARAIDFMQRSLHTDIDSINRDEIPALETDIEIASTVLIPMMRGFTWGFDGSGYITWSTGTVRYNGVDYTIAAGNSASSANDQWIYWDADPLDVGESEPGPEVFTMTLTPTLNDSRWFMMYYDGVDLFVTLQSPVIHGGLIQVGTVDADQIHANAITSAKIAADTIVAGDIAATVEARMFSTEAIRDKVLAWGDGDYTYINPGKILLHSGDTEVFTEWTEYSGGTTYIKGGMIYTDSILAASLNITDLADIATLIAGDITVGNATNSGTISLWSAATKGDSVIRSRSGAGYTDFGLTNAGFIMGFDDTDDKYKFEIGDTDDYFKWDGTDIVCTGITGSSYTLTGSDITCDTLTAKKTVQIGKDLVSGATTIKADGSGNTELRACYTDSSNYNIVTLSGDGLECFTRASSWPTTDGAIASATNDTYRVGRVGGTLFTYNGEFTSVYGNQVSGLVLQCDPQSSAPGTIEGGLYHNDTDDTLYHCVRDVTTLEWRRIGSTDEATLFSGSWVNAEGDTVTVDNGLIISVVSP